MTSSLILISSYPWPLLSPACRGLDRPPQLAGSASAGTLQAAVNGDGATHNRPLVFLAVLAEVLLGGEAASDGVVDGGRVSESGMEVVDEVGGSIVSQVRVSSPFLILLLVGSLDLSSLFVPQSILNLYI